MREIEPTEADVIRRIFQLSAAGHGVKAIAKLLNAEGAPSPRAQCGRSQTWAPSSVRAVLFRDRLSRRHHLEPDPQTESVGTASADRSTGRRTGCDIPAPTLQIVGDELWRAAHTRLDAGRALYLRGTTRAGVWTAGEWDACEVPADRLVAVRGLRQRADRQESQPRTRAGVLLRLRRIPQPRARPCAPTTPRSP